MDGDGLGGLERGFDDDLRGIPGKELVSLDARGKWFSRVEKPPDPGQNLVLTIDQTIQYIAERELQQGMEDTKSIAGTVVVENPRTGEILALANRPTFNPNVFNSVPAEALKNRAVSDIYEPGSVFKIVTYSAAHRSACGDAGRQGRLPARLDRRLRHEDPRPREPGRGDHRRGAGAFQRRGRHQGRHEAGRRAALPLHSRLRLRRSRPASSFPARPAGWPDR